jgi:hypothetical protein
VGEKYISFYHDYCQRQGQRFYSPQRIGAIILPDSVPAGSYPISNLLSPHPVGRPDVLQSGQDAEAGEVGSFRVGRGGDIFKFHGQAPGLSPVLDFMGIVGYSRVRENPDFRFLKADSRQAQGGGNVDALGATFRVRESLPTSPQE